MNIDFGTPKQLNPNSAIAVEGTTGDLMICHTLLNQLIWNRINLYTMKIIQRAKEANPSIWNQINYINEDNS
jgi:hypothetical protein